MQDDVNVCKEEEDAQTVKYSSCLPNIERRRPLKEVATQTWGRFECLRSSIHLSEKLGPTPMYLTIESEREDITTYSTATQITLSPPTHYLIHLLNTTAHTDTSHGCAIRGIDPLRDHLGGA